MSNPVIQDLEYIQQAAQNKEVVANAYETGFLFGRMAVDKWVSIGQEQPKREGRYLVTDGKEVHIAEWNGSGFVMTLKDLIPVRFWQLLPLPPRSEIGRD